jgi:hypothetical protein
MPHIHTFTALLGVALPIANAWGTLGHETVAFIAQDRMAAHTVAWAQDLGQHQYFILGRYRCVG